MKFNTVLTHTTSEKHNVSKSSKWTLHLTHSWESNYYYSLEQCVSWIKTEFIEKLKEPPSKLVQDIFHSVRLVFQFHMLIFSTLIGTFVPTQSSCVRDFSQGAWSIHMQASVSKELISVILISFYFPEKKAYVCKFFLKQPSQLFSFPKPKKPHVFGLSLANHTPKLPEGIILFQNVIVGISILLTFFFFLGNLSINNWMKKKPDNFVFLLNKVSSSFCTDSSSTVV